MTRDRRRSVQAFDHGNPAAVPDPRLARALLGALFVALVAVLSLPQARAASEAFGWTPLWLLAMPLSAWLALRAGRRTGAG